ncbi:MAG TPA: hypothetical protein VES40_08375 [Ilumatobacteraceae bacterium]|nr:hypothetical protein [Ilumatobacteraceae bacterium]
MTSNTSKKSVRVTEETAQPVLRPRAVIDIYEDDFDEVQMATWVKQAAALPGWGMS